jgi:hypothetical protein
MALVHGIDVVGPQPDADGWYKNTTGVRPKGEVTEIKWKCGITEARRPGQEVDWRLGVYEHYEVTAYRLAKPVFVEPRYWPKSRITEPLTLPTDSKLRKELPVYSGVNQYFPLALAYLARISKKGNDQHNPGQPLGWAKEKSTDHLDCCQRHLTDAGKIDPTDNTRETGKLAWRSLAALQMELEAAQARGENIWD